MSSSRPPRVDGRRRRLFGGSELSAYERWTLRWSPRLTSRLADFGEARFAEAGFGFSTMGFDSRFAGAGFTGAASAAAAPGAFAGAGAPALARGRFPPFHFLRSFGPGTTLAERPRCARLSKARCADSVSQSSCFFDLLNVW